MATQATRQGARLHKWQRATFLYSEALPHHCSTWNTVTHWLPLGPVTRILPFFIRPLRFCKPGDVPEFL